MTDVCTSACPCMAILLVWFPALEDWSRRNPRMANIAIRVLLFPFGMCIINVLNGQYVVASRTWGEVMPVYGVLGGLYLLDVLLTC